MEIAIALIIVINLIMVFLNTMVYQEKGNNINKYMAIIHAIVAISAFWGF